MNTDGIMGMLFETMSAQGKQLLPDDEQELLERVLQHGSGYDDGKIRIRVAVKKWGNKNDMKRLTEFVRDEYGTGGHSWEQGYFVDYGPGGLVIHRREEEHKYTWKRVAQTLVDMEQRSALYDVETMQKMYAIYQRMTGYPDPKPHMVYP